MVLLLRSGNIFFFAFWKKRTITANEVTQVTAIKEKTKKL